MPRSMDVLLVVRRLQQKSGEIMGVAAEEGAKQVAFVKCAGTCEKAGHDYEYTGVEDCAAMAFIPGRRSKEL